MRLAGYSLITNRAKLPADITSADVMKCVAVALMIVDHTGWLFFPHLEILRVLGRLCVPLWFFLIGYADTRKVPERWLWAGVLMLLSNIAVGLGPLPLSVLFTMALVRLVIDPVWAFALRRPHYFWWFVLLLVFFGFVSNLVVEYGTLGFLLASCGYVLRHRARVAESLGENTPDLFLIVALAAYAVYQCAIFGFSLLGVMIFSAGVLAIFFILRGYAPAVYPGTAAHPFAPLVRLAGRYTLEIYVVHLLAFKAIFGLQVLAAHLIG